ncbi:MAG: glycoside hydrolase family 3 C-terminal domain-containing protein [Enterobacterales bacterium endosymbiont of Blomia tropicalis]|uniref:beta-glucosidase n=1 Tax=Mixta mediterraneensis TaxID=2758443 RepID=UPI0025A7B9EF|nr:glycoside hydrolase family 3 C-terminal domain-containing protein [Mixta mediterraneensis]MDL4914886.1 glycoside hydrolase family 3 C-terminal domain-containing protein [Mixta mediterraneensis]
MKLHKAGLSAAAIFLSMPAWAVPQLKGTDSIPAVIAAMTPEEKASLVSGTGMNNAEKVAGAAGSTVAIPRLGIPQIVFADGPVGVRLGAGPTGGEKRFATGFPVSVAMAATWDPQLIQQVGGAIGNEARQYGVDLMLGPAINIQRNVLNGRNFEHFSEDPWLNAMITVGYINGMQAQGVGAVLKHFAANNQETRRQTVNEIISPRALREIYFPGFEYAMEKAQPWAVMSSYPAINGTPSSQNSWLLKDVLRHQWKFNGFVMSDWYGVSDPVRALQNGNDLNMPGGLSEKETPFLRRNTDPKDVILAALKSGELTQHQIDENIRNILNGVIKTHRFKDAGAAGRSEPIDHSSLARQVAADSMVLLKNDSATLPMPSSFRIAAFGHNVNNFFVIGGGSAEVNIDPKRLVTLSQGMKNAGLTLIDTIEGQPLNEQANDAAITRAAQQSDIALISVGRSSTEGADRYSMTMHADEVAMIERVSALFHQQNKKVVVVLNIGSPIEMASWESNADAILLAWQPGEQAGNAVADILTGKVNPSGKLPLTFPKRLEDSPGFGNYPGSAKTVIYGEGIYVGYRYFDTRRIAPMYPFGYGLSYSSVKYGKARPEKPVFNLDKQESIKISVQLHNLSQRETKEVVQLYVHDNASRLDRPEQELKAFEKVSLAAGAEKQVTLNLDKRAFSYFDEDRNDWVLEPGRFTLRIGSSSRDIHTEVPLTVTSSTPAFSFETPWIDIQTYEKAASIVAKAIGDEATNAWIEGTPTLGDKLDDALKQQPELMKDEKKKLILKQNILRQINTL